MESSRSLVAAAAPKNAFHLDKNWPRFSEGGTCKESGMMMVLVLS